ncbi:MAG: DUF3127 domain-containing protein [Opitutales bacterium]|nr:DUF3127 domain-containing protein [Opitutales bacterium]
MAYQLNGTIKLISDTQTFPSGFSKREFVVTTDDKFPQDIKLECLKEKGALLDNVKEGERVTVHFDLNGREYNGKYFVNLTAWKLEAGGASGPAAPDDAFPEDTTDYGSSGDEEIPF